MKVVMAAQHGSHGANEAYVEDLRTAFPDVTFSYAESEDEQIRLVPDADAFYGWPSRDVLLAAERLRWIQCPGTGIDHIARIEELVDSDVILTNMRGPHANPMADHVIGMMVTLAHRLHEMWDAQRSRRWDMKYDGRQVELTGSTMGILALGDIGRAIARRAHGFGMRVYAVDKHPGPPSAHVAEVWGLDRLDELLGISDWFVVTAPLTSETRGLIDGRRLQTLKRGAYVIVISRGGIVDEEALAEGLRSGRIAGATLDALAEEPLPESSPLWDMDNVLITPHSSALTPEMYEGRREIFKENLRRFLANEPFLYVCDKQAGF